MRDCIKIKWGCYDCWAGLDLPPVTMCISDSYCCTWIGEIIINVPRSYFAPIKSESYQEEIIFIMSCNCNFIFRSLTGKYPHLIVLTQNPIPEACYHRFNFPDSFTDFSWDPPLYVRHSMSPAPMWGTSLGISRISWFYFLLPVLAFGCRLF